MASLTTDRVFDRILKECQREAEKCVKEELVQLRAENKKLQKLADDALKHAKAEVAGEVKELEQELMEAQKDTRFAEKNGAYFEEQINYWFDDEVINMFRHIKDVAECTLKMQPEVLKKARTQRDAIEARYKKLAAKAKPTKKR
jgi:hypothetical protein